MRFPPRLALAASVLGVFAASSGTALMLPERAEEPVVPVPELAAASQPQAQSPAGPAAPVAPVVTGEQIAALALAPARERAAALVAERERVEAEESARAAARGDSEPESARERRDQWRELRDEIREACDDGRIRGPICRGT